MTIHLGLNSGVIWNLIADFAIIFYLIIISKIMEVVMEAEEMMMTIVLGTVKKLRIIF